MGAVDATTGDAGDATAGAKRTAAVAAPAVAATRTATRSTGAAATRSTGAAATRSTKAAATRSAEGARSTARSVRAAPRKAGLGAGASGALATAGTGARAGRRARPAAHDARTADIAELGRAFKHVFRSLARLRGRETHLTGGQLGHAQYELLFEFYEHGELSAGQLAAAAQLSPASVTQMLEHLALSGYVERARLECDRRVVVSRLTARGRREIEAKRTRWQSRWEHALADVDGAELRAATRVLARLSAVFEDDATAR